MAKVAKPHRKGVVKPPKVAYCAKGHELFRILVVPIKGRRRLEWACVCTVTVPTK